MTQLSSEDTRQMMDVVGKVKDRFIKTDEKIDKLIEDIVGIYKKHSESEERINRIEQMRHAKTQQFDSDSEFASAFVAAATKASLPRELGRGELRNVRISSKDITGVSRTIGRPTGLVVPGAAPKILLRDLLPQQTISEAGAITYTRETAFTNATAGVLEGAAKPKSNITYANVTSPFECLATYAKISKQTFSDLPSLAAAVENRLVYGLLAQEEYQLLKGSGTPPNLAGLYTNASAAAAAPGGATLVDTLRLAAGQLEAAGYMPTVSVVSSADWTTATMTKDTTGQYVTVPAGFLPQVIVSQWLDTGEWLVAALDQAARLFIREDVTVQIANQNEDDFLRNLLTILVEERILLALINSAALLKNPAVGLQAAPPPASKRESR